MTYKNKTVLKCTTLRKSILREVLIPRAYCWAYVECAQKDKTKICNLKRRKVLILRHGLIYVLQKLKIRTSVSSRFTDILLPDKPTHYFSQFAHSQFTDSRFTDIIQSYNLGNGYYLFIIIIKILIMAYFITLKLWYFNLWYL